MSTYSNRLQPALQMLFSERPLIYASCMTISGVTTEQHVIFCRSSATSLALRVIFNRTTCYNNHNVLFGSSARENHS